MGKRDEARARTTAAILAEGRRQLTAHGGPGMSMRAIARELGLVSSALYRYFPTRDALLTRLVVESYHHLADTLVDALTEAGNPRGAAAWRTLGHAFRGWSLGAPHEFHLIYGTPIPGYAAPPETIPAAAAVARPFLDTGAQHRVAEYASAPLLEQMASLSRDMADPDGSVTPNGLDPAGTAAVLAELAALVGFVGLELGGHFVGTADPADALWAALLDRQVATLRLA